jgi:hypothetical protein
MDYDKFNQNTIGNHHNIFMLILFICIVFIGVLSGYYEGIEIGGRLDIVITVLTVVLCLGFLLGKFGIF